MKKRRKKREDENRKKKKKKQSCLEILFIFKLKQLKGVLFSDFFDILWSSLTDPEPIENKKKEMPVWQMITRNQSILEKLAENVEGVEKCCETIWRKLITSRVREAFQGIVSFTF